MAAADQVPPKWSILPNGKLLQKPISLTTVLGTRLDELDEETMVTSVHVSPEFLFRYRLGLFLYMLLVGTPFTFIWTNPKNELGPWFVFFFCLFFVNVVYMGSLDEFSLFSIICVGFTPFLSMSGSLSPISPIYHTMD